jgi:hypothetical protein
MRSCEPSAPTAELMVEKEPAQPENSDEMPAESVKPGGDGPQEVEDAARQEAEYPEDETDEG